MKSAHKTGLENVHLMLVKILTQTSVMNGIRPGNRLFVGLQYSGPSKIRTLPRKDTLQNEDIWHDLARNHFDKYKDNLIFPAVFLILEGPL